MIDNDKESAETCASLITVVRVIVVNSQGEVLVLRRSSSSCEGGRWCLPGGKLDAEETIDAAARRELLEETGITAEVLKLVTHTTNPVPVADRLYQHFYFKCRLDAETVLNHESSECAWVNRDSLALLDLAFGDDAVIGQYAWEGSF